MTNDSNNKSLKNYAYIDSQNLNMTIQNLGWSVDWAKFREYLRAKHNVAVAYLFIGYIAENQDLYSFLQKAGFVIIFKPVVIGKEGNVKGNIDAELVLQVMIDAQAYDRAVVVTGDGDFHGLVNYLYAQNKLQALLVPNLRQYSSLLKGAARERIDFISNMRKELEYKKNRGRTSSSGSSGSSRRSPGDKLEDALIKAVDEGSKEPITAESPGDVVSEAPAVKTE
ncbi:MAG TPA: NYN domain-containing protein [Candidatus Saccharimonadales bacterium]|nr:NYN domain-containing protein [Candidatus Saccharimonadales bacterium]